MKRKLLTYDPSRKAGEQIKKPCTDCPFRRDSIAGWLGGDSPEAWIESVHGETRIVCHVYSDVQCAGAAIYRANVCKLVHDPTALQLEPDRETVFARSTEFLEHHTLNTPEHRLRTKLAARVKQAAEAEAKSINECAAAHTAAIIDSLDEAASDRKLPRDQYREVLKEVASDIEGRLDGLNCDDEADGVVPDPLAGHFRDDTTNAGGAADKIALIRSSPERRRRRGD